MLSKAIVYVILVCASSLHAAQGWKVSNYRLKNLPAPQDFGEPYSRLDVFLDGPRSRTIRGIATPFTRVKSLTVSDDTIIVLGAAGYVDAVLLIEIQSERPHWFFCFNPVVIGQRWIAYVEAYPNHTQAYSTDVVLLYDTHNPPPTAKGERQPYKIGRRVFPPLVSNADPYQNLLTNEDDAVHSLGPPLTALSSTTFGFISASSKSGANLVIADVTRREGDKPYVTTIPLPPEIGGVEIHPLKYLQTTSIERISDGVYRLRVPKWQFGTDSLEINKYPAKE